MIQRKIDGVGNVTGFWDTEENKWVPEADFDETTDLDGVVLDADLSQKRVDARAEEVAQAEETAANPKVEEVNDDPVSEDEEYEDMTNAELREELKGRGVDVASGLTKAELVKLLQESDEAVEK